VSLLLVLATLTDVAFLGFLAHRIARSRTQGVSLRLRIFYALAGAMLLGALATGLYATSVDAQTLGFTERFARVAPKGFLVASALIPVMAAAAARIAEGEPLTTVHAGQGAEAQKLARALTAMRREIEDKPYAAAFLRDAWHDLKTPVAAITATLEVLEDGALDDPDRAIAHRFLASLRRSADQLDRRLQDFVTLARFETSAIARSESTDVHQLVRATLDALRPLAQARQVRLIHDAGSRLPLRCDEAALARALTNLVENAIHASPGGSVQLRVSAEAHDVTSLEITNEPAAVPDARKERLFDRAASSSGSGLGLAIARAAIEAHGGRVSFTELGPPRVTVRIELPR
jgi:two-component system sensor histidine kinase CreC